MKLTTARDLKRDSSGKQFQRLIGRKQCYFLSSHQEKTTLQKMLKIEKYEF